MKGVEAARLAHVSVPVQQHGESIEHYASTWAAQVDPQDRSISSVAAAKADGLPELAETSGDQRNTSAQAPPMVHHRWARRSPRACCALATSDIQDPANYPNQDVSPHFAEPPECYSLIVITDYFLIIPKYRVLGCSCDLKYFLARRSEPGSKTITVGPGMGIGIQETAAEPVAAEQGSAT